MAWLLEVNGHAQGRLEISTGCCCLTFIYQTSLQNDEINEDGAENHIWKCQAKYNKKDSGNALLQDAFFSPLSVPFPVFLTISIYFAELLTLWSRCGENIQKLEQSDMFPPTHLILLHHFTDILLSLYMSRSSAEVNFGVIGLWFLKRTELWM